MIDDMIEKNEKDGGGDQSQKEQSRIGPPADHNDKHRPKSFDEIKHCIIDPDGIFRYM